jgi:hypothetical protein
MLGVIIAGALFSTFFRHLEGKGRQFVWQMIIMILKTA